MRSDFWRCFLDFVVEARKKGRAFLARPVCAEDIRKSLFDLEFVFISFVFV
jgi:hypothetical protein